MHHRWWRSMPHVVKHSFVSTLILIAVTAMAVCGSRFVAIASLEIKSKFEVYVLELLEYAVVVCDACCMLSFLVGSILKNFRSAIR
jgi:hypothetical protein